MRQVSVVLAVVALILATARIFKLRSERDQAFQQTRYYLLAVIAASLMLLAPITLGYS